MIHMKNRKSNISFGIAVLLSVLVIGFCTTETVMSQSKADDRRKQQYYAEMEEIYYHDLRGLLEESGYFNSGITIRWVSEEGEGRTYTVMIHHREIDLLSSSEKEALMQALSQAEFDDQSCRFLYEFLTV